MFTSNGIIHDVINSCIFYNFGNVQILKMPKVLINNQARASNECELVSKALSLHLISCYPLKYSVCQIFMGDK